MFIVITIKHVIIIINFIEFIAVILNFIIIIITIIITITLNNSLYFNDLNFVIFNRIFAKLIILYFLFVHL